MAIVKMSSFNLFAFDSDRDHLLHELQKFKYVHFLNLDENKDLKELGLENIEVPESIVEVEEDLSKVRYAIDLLSKYDTRETGIKALKMGQENFDFKELEERALGIDYKPIYHKIRELDSQRNTLLQEIAKCRAYIADLRPWKNLNTSISDLGTFEQSVVYMGMVPKKLKEKLETDLLDTQYTYFEIISEDKENIYVLAITINSESEQLIEILRSNSFSNIKLDIEGKPEQELDILEERIKNIQSQVGDYEKEIQGLSDHLPDLEIVYDYFMNKKLRLASSENFFRTESVNVIRGYIPTDLVEEFTQVVQSAVNNMYYLDIQEADKDDPNAPILLKNSKFAQSFESLTSMYALPRYNEVDPTPLLAPFYLIFFGMMGADLGYGLVMLIGTLVALKTFNLNESSRKFIKFFHYLSYSVILWGLIYGSIFGGIIPMKGLIDPAVDYNMLLILSIAFGAIHIYFALGIKAYMYIREGRILDALYDVGFWLMALTGGIIVLIHAFAGALQQLATISKWIMIAGMVGIVLTGGRESKNIGARLAGGLYELYGISSYVGDFVSYSRLMALGLSGGFIASAINMMADMLAQKGVIGILFAIVVFIVGQLFNLGLSVLGAYVHTIRLTFVEFFGKFYEGGGKAFRIFRSKSKYVNLN